MIDKNSALVVAHPDDEIIWFNSILDKVNKIYICYLNATRYGSYKEGRIKVLKEHPLKEKITCLDADDSTVKAKLIENLTDYRTIFTHNPWGEYGHPQHILVYTIIRGLQRKFKFDLWVSNFNLEKLELPTNSIATKIRDLYVKYDVWTSPVNSWTSSQSFCKVPKW